MDASKNIAQRIDGCNSNNCGMISRTKHRPLWRATYQKIEKHTTMLRYSPHFFMIAYRN